MSFLRLDMKVKLAAAKDRILGTLQKTWLKRTKIAGYTTPLGTTAVITGLGWVLYEVNATYTTLKTIGKVDIVSRTGKYIHIDENISGGLVLDGQGCLIPQLGARRLQTWAQSTRYKMAAGLLALAQGSDQELRREAVRRLAGLQRLSDADLRQLAQACDPATAVGLARTPRANPRLFLPPPKPTNREELVQEMKQLLYDLNQESDHLCIKQFLAKVFPEDTNHGNYFKDEEFLMEFSLNVTDDNQLVPICVEALQHHIAISNSEELLVKLGGLSTLMSVFQHFQQDINVIKSICTILARVTYHQGLLAEMHESGWIGVLASLLDNKEEKVRLLAGQSLSNLDCDDPSQAKYGKHVILLHPTHRKHDPAVDVVFVHGLLGGALITWRQRDHEETSLFTLNHKEQDAVDRLQRSSDTGTQDYLSAISEFTQQEWDQIGSDYEFVADDFPLMCKPDCTSQPLTFSGKDPKVRRYVQNTPYTRCWPKDWLPMDCPSIRVLGIDYESRLSEWFPSCSEKMRVKTLQERSATVLQELRRSRIGLRPVVWVAHSMGGLLVKRILTDSMSSCHFQDRLIASNTKAVVFLSTPHLGCPLAKLNDFLNYLLWPSKEVEELRLNSDILNDLQTQFLRYLDAFDVKIVTFTETKSTRLTSLGVDVHVVPPEFSHFDIGELYEMPCDHACVAKPLSRLSFIYDTVLNIIRFVKFQYTTP